MTFNNIIKKTVLESMQNNTLSTATVNITIGICILFALYIYLIYYVAHKKSFFSKQFGITLAVLPVITAGIIMAMQSNLVVSLGMVGALSIVRFRTAVKEPKDMVFLFWSISIGIILGAMNYKLALTISIAVTLLIFLLELLPGGKSSVLLVVNMDENGDEDELLDAIDEYVNSYDVKSRNRTQRGTDYIIECKTTEEKKLLDAASLVNHVINTSLVAHDGEAVY